MRTRDLKPDFWTDEKVVQLSDAAKLLFQGLWNLADREGRLEDKPVSIGFKVRPWDPQRVPELLDELTAAGLIFRYEVSGVRCIEVPTLPIHQRMHPREMASKLPPRPDGGGAGRGKARQGAPRHAIAPGSSGPSGSAKPAGPSGPSGSSGSSPPPPRAAPQLVVVGKRRRLTVDDLTPAERARWEHVQRARLRQGLLRETDPPAKFPDWCAELDRLDVDEPRLGHVLALYMRDDHWADRKWPTGLLIEPGVWVQRLPVPPEGAHA